MRDPSIEARAATVAKVAGAFDPTQLSAEERAIACDILGIMAHDAEARVRAALSRALMVNPHVPHDLALRLARDVAEVAVPFIEVSVALSEADLLRIIGFGLSAHQVAVAHRHDVTERVGETLAATGSEDAVSALMANEAAQVNERCFHVALDRFGDSPAVNEPMVRRRRLPMSVAERLVALVSDKLRDHLVTHHELPPNVAADLLLHSRERTLVGLLSDNSDIYDLSNMVADLHANGRLTPTLILRVLCTGNIDFFEEALAHLSSVPIVNARRLIHDPGPLGLRALYGRCNLPAQLFPMVAAAIEIIDETQYDGGPADRQRFVKRVIERVLTYTEDPGGGDDIDWLIGRLSRAIAAPSEAEAKLAAAH
jgi:uncharacterized protein (DUF2336 family)